MKPAVYTQPRASVPICWHCDKRLYAGGRAYVMKTVLDPVNGVQSRPFHKSCAAQYDRDPNSGGDEE